MTRRWEELAGSLPSLDSADEFDEAIRDSLGLPVVDLMLFATRVGTLKGLKRNELLDFASTFSSGFMFGFLEALEQMGKDPYVVLERIAQELSSESDDEEDTDDEDEPVMTIIGGKDAPPLIGIRRAGSFMRTQAAEIGKTFTNHDDDWEPMLYISSRKHAVMMQVEIPEDEEFRSALFAVVIPKLVKEAITGKPVVACMLTSTWALPHTDEAREWFENKEDGERISDYHDREEALVCFVADKTNMELWMATILRDGEQAPVLRSWYRADVGEKGETAGRIPEMMRKILR
jgi:hypothetical protein